MKLAFIGTGKIIADALHAVSPVTEIEKTAIYARPRSREKGEELAGQYQILSVYTDYEELLKKSDADTVYIGLINSAHYSYARTALLYGKNVILEKPFTGFYKEALELAELARKNKLFLLEAITILHGGAADQMKAGLQSLGPVRMFLANYSQYSSRYDEYLQGQIPHAFDKAYYGGALFDINVYNIHFCVYLFGEPKQVQYYPNIGPNGIDTSGTLVLSYDGFLAVCTGSKDSDSPCFVQIQGENGYMQLPGKPNIADHLILRYSDPDITEKVRDAAGAMVRAVKEESFQAAVPFHRMTPEFTEFARIIDTKDYDKGDFLLKESLTVIKVLEAARLSAEIRFES